ncbi:TPA: hypothetical protein JI043_12910 [Acinetobacter baumannii]|nr:hypothetical protein [Acinetobacter baumannii]
MGGNLMTAFQKRIIVLILLYFLFFAFAVAGYFYLGHISSSELGIDSKQIPQWSRGDLIAIFAAVGALMAPIAVLFGLHDWKRQHLTGEKLKLLFEINELIGDIKGIIDDVRDRNFYLIIKVGDLNKHEDFKNYFGKYYEIVNQISLKIHSLNFIDVDNDLKEVEKILVVFDTISNNFHEAYDYFLGYQPSEKTQQLENIFHINKMLLFSEPFYLDERIRNKVITEFENRYKSHFETIDNILKKAVTKI